MASQIVRCPFNPQHVMNDDSLQRHIIKCMKNYPNWLTCPYNALHRYPNGELLTKHMINCPDKDSVYYLMESEYQLNKNKSGKEVPVHIEGTRQFNLSEENWDKEYQ